MPRPEQLRVLIVDDSSDDAQLVVEALGAHDHEIVSCRVDQADALRIALGSGTWDIVISDYSMPLLASEEALSIVKDWDPSLPFIVVSGVIGEEAAVKMMRAGALDYVMKDRLGRLYPAIFRELRDAETRKRADAAETAMTELRNRLEATVERAPVGIVNVGRDGRFLHVNPRFCEMVAYSCDELLTLHFPDITHHLDMGRDAQTMDDMAEGRLAEYRKEKRLLRKDGEIVWASLSTAPVRDGDGKFLYFASIIVDITEKKQMEATLRERDERYRQIVDNAEEGIWTVDPESRTTFVNPRMTRMLGYSESEMSGRRIHDFVHDEALAGVNERAGRRHRGLSDSGEFVLRRKDGESLRIQLVASPLRAADGTNIGALAMVTDVTARWKAEETALRQKGELEEAQRIAHVGSWRRDLPGEALEWSEELYRIFGADPGSSPTVSSLLDAVLPEDREKVVASIARAQENSVPLDLDYRIVRPDGTIRTVHTSGETTRNSAGVATHIRGVTQDVTDRIAAATVHENLTRHLQLLLESTTQGIFGMDSDSRCTFINRAASDILGYAPGELVGALMHDVVHQTHAGNPYSAGECPIGAASRTGVATEVQSDMFSRRDRTPLPVEYSAAPIIDTGTVSGAVVVFTDVSERKLLQSQLEQSDRVSSLGRLAATMAHEFNNVLMGIQPFAEQLSRQTSGHNTQGATSNILQAVQRGRSITQSILHFARPAEIVKEKIDVKEWLGSMEGALAAVVGEGVRLRIRVKGDSLFICGDRHQLAQVLTNLATNARDAMHEVGQLSIVVGRGLSGYVFPFGAIPTVDQYLHLSVADTGCGMDPRTLKHVFDPFFTTKRSGTGLGLALVHQVIQLHGGSIVPESVVGEGTVFHLFLPFSQEAFDENETERIAGSALLVEDENVPSSGGARLLPDEGATFDVAASGANRVFLVEDDEHVREGVAALLELMGYEVVTARSGEEAIELAVDPVPHILLSDVTLPGIAGPRVAALLRERWPDLKIILMSGYFEETIQSNASRDGWHFLQKPFEADQLAGVLSTAMNGDALHVA